MLATAALVLFGFSQSGRGTGSEAAVQQRQAPTSAISKDGTLIIALIITTTFQELTDPNMRRHHTSGTQTPT